MLEALLKERRETEGRMARERKRGGGRDRRRKEQSSFVEAPSAPGLRGRASKRLISRVRPAE